MPVWTVHSWLVWGEDSSVLPFCESLASEQKATLPFLQKAGNRSDGGKSACWVLELPVSCCIKQRCWRDSCWVEQLITKAMCAMQGICDCSTLPGWGSCPECWWSTWAWCLQNSLHNQQGFIGSCHSLPWLSDPTTESGCNYTLLWGRKSSSIS